MADLYKRLAAMLALWLTTAAPGFAQTVSQPATDRFWPLLLPNAAVALIGLGWVLLMTRKRG